MIADGYVEWDPAFKSRKFLILWCFSVPNCIESLCLGFVKVTILRHWNNVGLSFVILLHLEYGMRTCMWCMLFVPDETWVMFCPQAWSLQWNLILELSADSHTEIVLPYSTSVHVLVCIGYLVSMYQNIYKVWLCVMWVLWTESYWVAVNNYQMLLTSDLSETWSYTYTGSYLKHNHFSCLGVN